MIKVQEIILVNKEKYIRPQRTTIKINKKSAIYLIGEYFILKSRGMERVCLSSLPEVRGEMLI